MNNNSILNNIRNDKTHISRGKFVLFCAVFLIIGALAGVLSKIVDRTSEILGNFTSGMCLWIMLGTLMCAFSKNPFRAAAYVFLFCAGMIGGYYLTAELAGWYYSVSFVKGWCVFTLFTPIFALLTWYARGNGVTAWVLRIGIVAVMAVSFFVYPGNMVLDALSIAAAFTITMIRSKEINK